MDLVNIAMRVIFSLTLRLISLFIVLKFVMELRKKDVPVVVPSQVRFPRASPSYTPEEVLLAGSSKSKEGSLKV